MGEAELFAIQHYQRERWWLPVDSAGIGGTRHRQRRMLTNYKNWSIDTSKQKGWLQFLTEEEYDTICRNGAQIPAAEPERAHEEPSEPERRSNDSTGLGRPTQRCSAEYLKRRQTLPENVLTWPFHSNDANMVPRTHLLSCERQCKLATLTTLRHILSTEYGPLQDEDAEERRAESRLPRRRCACASAFSD